MVCMILYHRSVVGFRENVVFGVDFETVSPQAIHIMDTPESTAKRISPQRLHENQI